MKVDKKIVGYKVLSQGEATVKVEVMGEHIERPEVLIGATYKTRPSNSECAFYITINDIVLNGVKHPYEIFINSKGVAASRMVALCRVLSAVFRKGGDIIFIAEELKQVFDPAGPYTSRRCYPGGKRKRFNSLEAEIGDILEEHLTRVFQTDTVNILSDILSQEGLEVDFTTLKEVDKCLSEPVLLLEGEESYPDSAVVCPSCGTKAAVLMDGCLTCLSCGHSKCG